MPAHDRTVDAPAPAFAGNTPDWPIEWINTEILQQLPTAAVVLDLKGRVMATNRAMRRLFGYPHEEAMRQLSFDALHHADHRESAMTYLSELTSGRLQRHVSEVACLAAGDREFRARIVAAPVFDSSGRPRAVSGLVSDITVEVSDREALRRSGDHGSDALVGRQDMTTFVASVGHELRAPLHGILGLSEILAESNLDAADLKLVGTIRREAENLKVVVDDLLDLSKLEAGKLRVRSEPYSPALVAAGVNDLLQPEASAKGLVLSVKTDPGVPDQVVGDGHRVRQVLLNIATNAVRYTDAGSVTIEVDYLDSHVVRFRVIDTGVGIPTPELNGLFDAFAQNHDGRVGSGLGLTVVKQLTELMHGDLLVESEVGRGSTFTVELPAVRADRRRADSALRSGGETAEPVSSDRTDAAPERSRDDPAGRRVLVADDTEVNQLLARNQLNRLGYEVVVVANGHEALQKAISDEFAAILMDWHMPVMDGLESTRRIRASGGRGATVPIIAVTANVLHGNRDICIEAGMNDFLSKPVGLDDLKAALDRWITPDQEDERDHDIDPEPQPMEQPTDPNLGGERSQTIDRAPSAPATVVDRTPVAAPPLVPPPAPIARATTEHEPQAPQPHDHLRESADTFAAETTANTAADSAVATAGSTGPEPAPSADEPAVSRETLAALAEELGDVAVVITVIEAFLDELDDRSQSIEAIPGLLGLAPEQQDEPRTEAMRSAHTLKSTSALLGGEPLAEKCQAIESHLKAGEVEPAAALVPAALALIAGTRTALQAFVADEG